VPTTDCVTSTRRTTFGGELGVGDGVSGAALEVHAATHSATRSRARLIGFV